MKPVLPSLPQGPSGPHRWPKAPAESPTRRRRTGLMFTLLSTRWLRSTSSAAAFAPATPGAFAPGCQELIVDIHGARLKQDDTFLY